MPRLGVQHDTGLLRKKLGQRVQSPDTQHAATWQLVAYIAYNMGAHMAIARGRVPALDLDVGGCAD
jgi:hypothetical protein